MRLDSRRLTDSAARAARGAWKALPEGVTGSDAGVALRRHAARALTGGRLLDQRVVRTVEELDEVIAELEQAVRVSDDALRRGFASFRMEVDWNFPADPFSDGYRAAVLDLYEWLHGGPYATDNEMTAFNPDEALVKPFPYLTGNPQITGDYLVAVGHLVRTIGLGPGSRILELGAGWGNVALPLAQLGCSVTAVDVCPEFVDLMSARAEQLGLTTLNPRLGDYATLRATDGVEGPYDAIVFFESFHHAVDHNGLLESLNAITSPDGILVFGAEPIDKAFWQPWGPRLDGESLWAIRRNGWLELGFQTPYFLEALRRRGWKARLVACPGNVWGKVWVASRA
jgi:SAM-dependent methyltransferase